MTVSELQKELSKYPGTAEVRIADDSTDLVGINLECQKSFYNSNVYIVTPKMEDEKEI